MAQKQAKRVRRHRRDEKRVAVYEQSMAQERDIPSKKQGRYERFTAEEEMTGRRGGGRSGYGNSTFDGDGYGGRRGIGRRRGGGGGLIGGLIGAASGNGKSREYEDAYENRSAPHEGPSAPYGNERDMRRSLDDRSGSYASGGLASSNTGYPDRRKARRGRKGGGGGVGGGGLIGTVRRVMKEDVLYLMIVNMPSQKDLAEARELLAQAKNGY